MSSTPTPDPRPGRSSPDSSAAGSTSSPAHGCLRGGARQRLYAPAPAPHLAQQHPELQAAALRHIRQRGRQPDHEHAQRDRGLRRQMHRIHRAQHRAGARDQERPLLQGEADELRRLIQRAEGPVDHDPLLGRGRFSAGAYPARWPAAVGQAARRPSWALAPGAACARRPSASSCLAVGRRSPPRGVRCSSAAAPGVGRRLWVA